MLQATLVAVIVEAVGAASMAVVMVVAEVSAVEAADLAAPVFTAAVAARDSEEAVVLVTIFRLQVLSAGTMDLEAKVLAADQVAVRASAADQAVVPASAEDITAPLVLNLAP